jgi:hypothetical protein
MSEEITSLPEGAVVEVGENLVDYLNNLEAFGKAGRSCILLNDEREIGAFVPMEDYLFLCQVARQEAAAEDRQDADYTDGEHQPEPWLPWSETRRQLAVEGGGGGTEDPARQP